jgi:hypothetical protein
MSKDMIRYDLLVQDALKGVVRKVMGDAIRDGLPGDHHFYVSFRTDFPGVRLSQRLREKYPQDMTVVLQHQFWDLTITEHTFEVGLSFSGVPERLLVPFDAVTGFFDPSVQFGLKFELHDESAAAESESDETPARPPQGSLEPIELQTKKSAARPPAKSAAPKITARQTKPADEPDKAAPKAQKPEKPTKPEPGNDKDKSEPGAEVVSLDAFRKKN